LDETLYATDKAFDERCLAILAEPPEGIVCTVGPGSAPHSVPTWYLFENDRFLISTHSRSRRARNILENAIGRVLVVHFGGWISGTGAARLLFGEEFEALHDGVLERYLTEEGREKFVKAAAFPDDCILEILAEKKSSWSKMSVAANIQKAGFSFEESANWFVPLAH
jgi:hypothetical protein